MGLPEDYKELASVYGPGRFAGYLQIFHPHARSDYVDLTGPMPARIRAQLHKDYTQGSHPVPYDPQRLFLMGNTDNGEYLFWITEPPEVPDSWRIAINEARGPRWFTFDGTLTAFLVSVLNGETVVPQFPDDLLQGETGFTRTADEVRVPLAAPAAPPVNSDVIREWARANGYEVPFRGRIPAAVRDAWERATQGGE
ncbi:Lsr2 family protein [Streptomyces sp. ISL-12]|nr:Lsr2 family protein [Streptomyces sp. ISL-12]